MAASWSRRIVWILAAAAVGGGLYWALREQPTPVDIAQVTSGPMQVTIREEGVARVRDVYAVSAPIGGHLARVLLQEGDRVEAGKTVIARIHPLDPPLVDRRTQAELTALRDAARSGVGIAEVELQKAEATLRLAGDENARALKLFRPGLISESAVQKVQSELELAQATVEAAKATIAYRRAELASAEARLLPTTQSDPTDDDCCVDVLAPVDGTVLALAAQSEQPLAVGARIADIGNTGDLEVLVDLLSADALRIAPGTAASITEWGGNDPLPAKVRRIEPAAFTKVSALGIEEQRVNVALDLEKGDPRLGHNYRVMVELAVWDCGLCLRVPVSALYRVGDQWTLFSINEGRARQAPVSIGQMNDEVAEVIDGVAAGATVIVHPADTIADGTLVMAR